MIENEWQLITIFINISDLTIMLFLWEKSRNNMIQSAQAYFCQASHPKNSFKSLILKVNLNGLKLSSKITFRQFEKMIVLAQNNLGETKETQKIRQNPENGVAILYGVF